MAENINAYLTEYGWAFKQAEDGSWETGWSNGERSFPMSIQLTETWLSLEIQPLLNLDIDWQEWPELSALLLEINHTLHMVRLSLSEEGEIVLSTQVFCSQLNYDVFHDAVGVLGHYAEMLFQKLLDHAVDIGALGDTDQMLLA